MVVATGAMWAILIDIDRSGSSRSHEACDDHEAILSQKIFVAVVTFEAS